MAKDTSSVGKDSSGNEFDRTKNATVKKGLEKNAARADEVIVAQSKLGKDDPRSAKNEDIQAGNAARMKDLSPSNPAPKNPNVEPLDTSSSVLLPKGSDPLDAVEKLGKRKSSGKRVLTPKTPSEKDPTPKQEATTAARRGTVGRRQETGNLNFGNLPKRAQSAFDKPEAVDNRIERVKSGMGLPGSQNGDLDLALKLHGRDLALAKSSGKIVNGVNPTDSPRTTHMDIVTSPHHTAFARVMRVMGIADEAVYKSAAGAAGMRLEKYVEGLHAKVQQHEDSKTQTPMPTKDSDYWEHPRTKEIIPVSANHPDMPSTFTRTKGLVNKVTRGADGSEIRTAGHNGWDRMRMSDGKSVLRLTSAPTKGTDLIDHLRVQMLSEHGPSSASRKKGADIASDIADVASGAVPRGMKRSGKRKVASEPYVVERKKKDGSTENVEYREKYADSYSPVTRTPNPRAFDKPTPPGVKGLTSQKPGRDTSAIQDGKYLLGSKPPADLPDFSAKGPRMVQPKLPGTGVPKAVSTEVTPAEVVRGQGPLEKRAYELDGTQVSKGTKFTLEDFYPKIETKPAVREVSYLPTDRDWKPESDENNPNRGRQFKVETSLNPVPGKFREGVYPFGSRKGQKYKEPEMKLSLNITPDASTEMTGAQEVRDIAARGELGSQKKAGKALVVRPGGKRQAKKDRAAAPKPLVQGDLFPDYSVKEGRKNAFYMAGSVKDASETTKQLQGDSKKRFGRMEDSIAVEGKYSGADDAKLEQPEGSRADKKNVKKLATES